MVAGVEGRYEVALCALIACQRLQNGADWGHVVNESMRLHCVSIANICLAY